MLQKSIISKKTVIERFIQKQNPKFSKKCNLGVSLPKLHHMYLLLLYIFPHLHTCGFLVAIWDISFRPESLNIGCFAYCFLARHVAAPSDNIHWARVVLEAVYKTVSIPFTLLSADKNECLSLNSGTESGQSLKASF